MWGQDRDAVTIGRGRDLLDDMSIREFPYEDHPEHLTAVKGGNERQVVPIGDAGAPVAIWLAVDKCPYIAILPGAEYDEDGEVITPGYTNEEAAEYAERL